MNVIHKDATIVNTDEDFPGSFEVILSTADKDRDGDELLPEDWQQPLPDHITFDMDHGMSVEKTIGSGVPTIEDGKLIVRGTYSSLPRAQEVRTLVNEGHINTTSVAFTSHKVTKDGKTRTERELLNGAFVAIPANLGAKVLASKGIKAGARNSANDQKHLQDAHDSLVQAGAACAGPMDDSGAEEGATGGKNFLKVVPLADLQARYGLKAKYNAETLRTMLDKGEAMANANGDPSYPIADEEDLENAIQAVGRGQGDHDKIRAYIIGRAKALGLVSKIPDNWNTDGSMKSVSDVQTKDLDPNSFVSMNIMGSAGGLDISISAWCAPAADVDAYTDTAQRALMAALTIASAGPVDDDDDSEGTAVDSAAPAGAAAKSADAEALEVQMLALQVIASAFTD